MISLLKILGRFASKCISKQKRQLDFKFTEKSKIWILGYGGIGDHLFLVPLIQSLSQEYQVIFFYNKKFEKLIPIFAFSKNVEFIVYKSFDLFLKLFKRRISDKEPVIFSFDGSFVVSIISVLFRTYFFGLLDNKKLMTISGIQNVNEKLFFKSNYYKSNLYQLLAFKSFNSSREFITPKINSAYFSSCEDNIHSQLKSLKYIVLSPEKSIGWEFGELSESFIEIFSQRLFSKFGYKAVVIGGREKVRGSEFYIDLRGKTQVTDLPYILSNALVIVSADNGLLHLTNLLGMAKKVITFFSFSNPKLFSHPNNKIWFKRDLPCMPCIPAKNNHFDINQKFVCPINGKCLETFNNENFMKYIFQEINNENK